MFKGEIKQLPSSLKWSSIIFKNAKQAEHDFYTIRANHKNLDLEMRLDNNIIHIHSEHFLKIKFPKIKNYDRYNIETTYSTIN